MPSRFPFSATPIGWYRVAASADIARGAQRTLRYFGQDLVLFRSEAGQVRLLEPWCPHLGAHLGKGGRVEGENLVCPFHGWRIGGDGAVASVPYSQHRPPRVCVRTWPLREVNGQVMAWVHPQGAAPEWEPPDLPETSDPEWTGFLPARSWTIRTHVQEICENGTDNAHFTWLHGQQTQGMRTDEVCVEGPVFTHRSWQDFNIFGLAKLFVDKVEGPLDVAFHGLGIVVNRAIVHARIDLHYTFVFFTVPVDDETIELHSMLSMKRLPSRLATRALWQKAATEGGVTIDQDVPIWEAKRWTDRPVLMPEDGPYNFLSARGPGTLAHRWGSIGSHLTCWPARSGFEGLIAPAPPTPPGESR